MIGGILFDKDGTLIEFHSTMHHIYTNIFASLKGRYRIPELLLQQLKGALGYLPDQLRSGSLLQFSTNPQIVEGLLDASRAYAAEFQWKLPFTAKSLLALLEEHSVSEDVPYTALPGALETLNYLKNKEYKLGIATADTHASTVIGLKKVDMFDYFDYLGTSSEESRPKPETFMADMFCAQCNIAPNELLVVGDSENDMMFAKNVGAQFIGIDTPYNDDSAFRNMGYRSISNLIEIIDIFRL